MLTSGSSEIDCSRRVLLALSAANLLIFMGAGAQQQYLVTYLGAISGWGAVKRALVQATVYLAMMMFRLVNVWLLRRWSDRTQAIVGSLTYTGFCLAMAALFWLRRGVVLPGGEGASYAFALLSAAVWGWGGAAFWAGTSLLTIAATDEERRGGGGKGTDRNGPDAAPVADHRLACGPSERRRPDAEGRRRYGTVSGVLLGSTHAGWFVGVLLLGRLNEVLPPQHAFWLYLVAAAVTLPGTVVLALSPKVAHLPPEPPSLARLREVATSRKALIACFILLCSALTFGLMLGAFGDFVQAAYGKQYLWMLASLYPLARMVFSVAGGAVSDRVGRAAALGTGFAVAAAGMLASSLWRAPMAAGLAATTLGITSGVVPVIGMALVGDSAERSRRPLVYGFLFAARDLGVFAAAVLSRVIEAGRGDFAPAFAIFAVVFALCGGAAIPLSRRAAETI